MPKFVLAGYMQLTCPVKKLFHFKCKIADAKKLHFDLMGENPGLAPREPTSLQPI